LVSLSDSVSGVSALFCLTTRPWQIMLFFPPILLCLFCLLAMLNQVTYFLN